LVITKNKGVIQREMKQYLLVIVAAMVFLTGCSSLAKHQGLSEIDAISKVLELEEFKAEYVNFPAKPGVKTIESNPPGPAPDKNTTKMKTYYSTQVAQAGKETYIVTLAKNHNVVLNKEELIAYWVYKVTPDNVKLIKSENNTDILRVIK
jgi:hypothetical protein